MNTDQANKDVSPKNRSSARLVFWFNIVLSFVILIPATYILYTNVVTKQETIVWTTAESFSLPFISISESAHQGEAMVIETPSYVVMIIPAIILLVLVMIIFYRTKGPFDPRLLGNFMFGAGFFVIGFTILFFLQPGWCWGLIPGIFIVLGFAIIVSNIHTMMKGRGEDSEEGKPKDRIS